MEEVLSFLKSQGSEFSEEFVTLVKSRLSSLGYTGEDNFLLGFSIKKIEDRIKRACNLSIVPKGLYSVAVDMVCGELLFAAKSTGKLEGFDLEEAVKQVHLGDTSVTFEGKSSEQKFELLLKRLMSGEKEFICYRRLKW